MEKSYDTAERLLFKLVEEAIYKLIRQEKIFLPLAPKPKLNVSDVEKYSGFFPIIVLYLQLTIQSLLKLGSKKIPKQPKNLVCFNCPNMS